MDKRQEQALGQLVTELDAETQGLRLIARALVQDLAVASGDRKKYVADFFGRITALPDQIEMRQSPGEYADERRAAIRRSIDAFAGEMARDLGLATRKP